VVWEADYKPFGEAGVNGKSTVVNNFRFAGQYYDEETGLHYNWHRYYDPKNGRYLTPDPIGLLGGINPYVYTLNNPINAIDPFGLDVFGINTGGSAFWGVGAGASSAVLFQSDGKTNRIGYVTTQEGGAGAGTGLFVNVVYGPYGTAIEDYANTSVSNSGNLGYGTYSWSFGENDKVFYEAGISPIPGEAVGLTHTTGQVIFAFEYSFGAADTFYGDLLFEHRKEISAFFNYLFGGLGYDIHDIVHNCK
jgi:RHS repeat-associated protein